MARQILFLCTGNYYRSRFAEILFNHLASEAGLDFVASSRALAIELGIYNVGPISAHTRSGLERRNIPLPEPLPFPQQCAESDLATAYRVIAVKEMEHRPLLTKRYPDWPDRVQYWHVHDLDGFGPEEALGEIEIHVRNLVDELREAKE